VSRSLDEDALDRVRSHHATASYAKAMRKRKVWVEPLFAEAKDQTSQLVPVHRAAALMADDRQEDRRFHSAGIDHVAAVNH